MKPKFYHCPVCGNVVVKLVDSSVTPSCCGQPMHLLSPDEMNGKEEYHAPDVERIGKYGYRVTVGEEPHPMTAEHNIRFIAAVTPMGGSVRLLRHDEAPTTTFCLDDTPCSFYAYCNLHGLWRTKFKPTLSDDTTCSIAE